MAGGSKESLCGYDPHAMDKANNDLLPAEGFDQVVDVAAEDFVDGSKRIGVGDSVVIQRSTEEVTGRIRQKELHRRGGVAFKVVIDAIDAGVGVGIALFGNSVRADGVVEDHADALVSKMTKSGD